MIVLDASVWVSSLRSRDVNHKISLRWTTRWVQSGETFAVPTLFLAEVGSAVARPSRDSAPGRRAVADILGDAAFVVVPVDQTLAGAAGNHAADLFLRGADAVHVALAERLGVPLVTWDNDQLAWAATVIKVQTPAI